MKVNKMKHNKDHYRNKGKELGMSWGGCDEGVHFFQSGNYKDKFKVMYCTEECLENGNAEYMVKHDLTLSDEKVRSLQAKYRKKHYK